MEHGRFFRSAARLIVVSLLLGIAFAIGVGIADTVTLPHTFSTGGVIYASQMNANFEALETGVNAINDANIVNGGITGSSKLVDLSVTLGKLASSSVDSSKIVDTSVALGDLASNSVDSSKIVDTSVALGDLASNSVDASKVVADSIVVSDLKIGTAGAMSTIPVLDTVNDEFDFWAVPATSFVQVEFDTLTTADRYGSLLTGVWDAAEGNVKEWVAPRIEGDLCWHIHSFYVFLDTAPGAGDSYAFTLRTGTWPAGAYADTAATCTVTGTNTSCTVDSIDVTLCGSMKGATIFADATGTPTGATFTWIGFTLTPSPW